MNPAEQLAQIQAALTGGAVGELQASVQQQLESGWDALGQEAQDRYQANVGAVVSSLAATKSALASMAVHLRTVQGTTSEWQMWQLAATIWKVLVDGLQLPPEDAHRYSLDGEEDRRGVWSAYCFRSRDGVEYRTDLGNRGTTRATMRDGHLYVRGHRVARIVGISDYGNPLVVGIVVFGVTLAMSLAAVAWAWAVIEVAQALQSWVQAQNNELSARVESMRSGKELPASTMKAPVNVEMPGSGEDSSMPPLLFGGLVVAGGIYLLSRRRG